MRSIRWASCLKPDARRIARLHRLEKVRAIARQAAALEAAEAESTLARLMLLADRTAGLAASYAARGDAADGAALRQLVRFREGLDEVRRGTSADVASARTHADGKSRALSEAERQRQAVEDRRVAGERALAASANAPSPTGARRFGTGLE